MKVLKSCGLRHITVLRFDSLYAVDSFSRKGQVIQANERIDSLFSDPVQSRRIRERALKIVFDQCSIPRTGSFSGEYLPLVEYELSLWIFRPDKCYDDPTHIKRHRTRESLDTVMSEIAIELVSLMSIPGRCLWPDACRLSTYIDKKRPYELPASTSPVGAEQVYV
jgi:hypothetical protein